MNIEENKSLQALNCLAVPSIARYYVEANSLEEIRQAVEWSKANGHRLVVLAGGSNVLLKPIIDGLVLQPKLQGIELVSEEGAVVKVKVGAGENWHQFVVTCVGNRYYGIENLALIPGDCGAAPIQNIGAYGVELKDVFEELEALNMETMEVETLDKSACEFNYRDSVFKRIPGKYIILNVTFSLSRESQVNTTYPALIQELRSRKIDEPTPRDVINAVIDIRASKLPDPSSIPNAGSYFKNPIVDAETFERIKQQFPSIVAFDTQSGQKKLAAGWLLDNAGWKGKSVRGIKMHDDHALVLTNPNHSSAESIMAAVEEIQLDIRDRFGITLEPEPLLLG